MGAEPAEVHEHYDAEGNYAGRTVVTREPEWDDEQREVALEHVRHKKMIHRGCGNHMSVALDPTVARHVDHFSASCEDCAAIERERAAWHSGQRHEGELDRCKKCEDEVFYISKREPITEEMAARYGVKLAQ